MENQVTLTTEQELALVKAKQDAAFSLTPAGQYKAEFEVLQRMGKMYAESTIVPDTYKKNVGNCIIAVEMAKRMGAMPLMVMQNLYVVHGTPAFSMAESLIEGLPYSEAVESKTREKLRSLLPQLLQEYAEQHQPT